MRILTLTTDFGTRDPYLAELKGACLSVWSGGGAGSGGVRLVDLSHELPARDVAAAAWFLGRTHGRFPAGTVHLAVVDPGVGTDRPLVAVAARRQLFVAPGNGLLDFLAGATDLQVARLDDPRWWRPGLRGAPAPTFHGRDVMGPVAAHLAVGVPLADVGSAGVAADLGAGSVSGPGPPDGGDAGGAGTCLGRVVWIDSFGNAISDVDRESEAGRGLARGAVLRLGQTRLVGPYATFGAAPPDTPFWYWGSGGCLEAALRDRDGAAVCGWHCGLAIRRDAP